VVRLKKHGDIIIVVEYIPDLLTISGLSLLGYGLYLFAPWVAYVVCGGLVFTGGVALTIAQARRK